MPGYSSATALPALWIAAILVGGVALVMIVSTITFAVSPHHSTDVPAPFVSTSAAAQSAEPTPPKPCFPFQTDC